MSIHEYPRLGDSVTTFTQCLGEPLATSTLAGLPVWRFADGDASFHVLFDHDRAMAIHYSPKLGAKPATEDKTVARPGPADMAAGEKSRSKRDQIALISSDGGWTLAFESCPREYVQSLHGGISDEG